MSHVPSLPARFRLVRTTGLLAGLLLSSLAIYDWAITIRLAVNRPLAIVPDAETWTSESLATALDKLGLPAGFFSATALFFNFLFLVAFLLCGWTILWKKGRDWYGLCLGLILLIWADGTGVFFSVPPIDAGLEHLKVYLAWIGWPGLFLTLLYFFPSGHVTPRWARWFATLLGVLIVYGLAATAMNVEIVGAEFGFAIIIPCLMIGGYSQVHRYRHATPAERQQVKWVVMAGLIFVLFFIVLSILLNVLGAGDPATASLTTALSVSLAILAIATLVYVSLPVSITLAMFRYRLWDVDVIVRRTLQYSVLTGVLALVYFGSVILLQTIVGQVTDEKSPVVIVLSTLLIAALFAPLRRRVQRFIDRRFYRAGYDAAQMLARFGQRARDEVELEALTAELVQVVQETMQPKRLSLWLAQEAVSGGSSAADGSH